MENTGFATFSPFTNKMNTPENIANYYADLQQQTGVNLLSNNSNPFMENYLGIKPINEVSTTIESPKKGITDWLKEAKESLPIVSPEVTKTNSGETVDLSKGETGNAKRAIDYLTKKEGLSKELATAITANLKHESGFNTSAVGDTNLGKGQEAVGLAQWRLGRKDELMKFLKDRGLPSTSFEGQLSFLVHELKGKENKALKQMSSTTDVGEMAKIFDRYYERSTGTTANKRAALAKQLYSQI